MQRYKLSDSGARGWFIGDFARAVFRPKTLKSVIKKIHAGQTASHIHKLVHEITLVISGSQICNGEIFTAGDICVLEPGDISQIEYLEETEVVTIKTPSIPSDKYLL
jgi:hypothetical protein